MGFWRNLECFGQGLVQGLAGGVASVGDFAINAGYNWTTRHAINAFRSEDNQVGRFDPNLADNAAEAVRWTEAENNTERGYMAAGRATGEVAGFALATVATAGTGGLVYGAARVGAGATRLGAALTTGGRFAVNTAHVMNPVASRAALAVESGAAAFRGTQLYNQDAEAERNATTIRTHAGLNVLQDATARQEYLNQILDHQAQELRDIGAEMDRGNLTEERQEQLRTRLREIREAKGLIDATRTEGITDTQMRENLQRLQQLYPDIQTNLLLSGYSSSYTRAADAGTLSRTFADGGQQVAALPAVRQDFAASVRPAADIRPVINPTRWEFV